jgi:hypothetical protein
MLLLELDAPNTGRVKCPVREQATDFTSLMLSVLTYT